MSPKVKFRTVFVNAASGFQGEKQAPRKGQLACWPASGVSYKFVQVSRNSGLKAGSGYFPA